MARTLIGNIKGKNGRGITSIEKTGTTGPVDTYTITYTDSTTSTFTINNSNSVSLQRQIVPSAAVESSATASQAYAAGDYVVVNGLLRKVKAAIAKGNAISDSNSTATTVTGELATLGDSVSPTSGKAGSVSYFKAAGIVIVSCLYIKVTINSSWGSATIGRLPEGFRPAGTVIAPIASDWASGSMSVDKDGTVKINSNDKAISTAASISSIAVFLAA